MADATVDSSASRTDPAGPLLISRDVIEERLAALGSCVTNPTLGLFGPGSLMWQVGRESACFQGAGRALLQLARPWIAQAIANHSPVWRERGAVVGRSLDAGHHLVWLGPAHLGT